MTAPDRPRGILGDADRCCPPGLCVYSPGLVAGYIAIIRAARAHGEDPTAARVLARGSCEQGRGSGVSTSLDVRFVSRLWDVERAMSEGAVTIEEVCRKLCPWGLEDDE